MSGDGGVERCPAELDDEVLGGEGDVVVDVDGRGRFPV